MRINRNLYIDICMKQVYPTEKVQDLIILLVLSGSIFVQSGGYGIELPKNSIYIIPADGEYSMRLPPSSLVARFTFNYAFLCEKANQDYIRFSNSAISDDEDFQKDLRNLLRKSLIEFAENGNQCTLKGEVLTYNLVLLLAEKFATGESSVLSSGWTDDRRIAAIQNYVRTNYSHSVSLTEIAEKMYVSVSTLSRLFQRKTGISFVQYVRNYRLEQVRRALLESDESITTIAVNAGFSSSSAMNRDFRALYQMTPKEYREKHRPEERKKAESQWKQNRSLLNMVAPSESGENQLASSSGHLFIHADMRKQQTYKQWSNKIINVGPAISVNNPKLRSQILTAHRQLSGEYYRIWSLRSRRLLMADEAGKKINFDQLDGILDFFIEHNLPLFIDLGPRTMLTRVSEKKVIYNSADQEIVFESQIQWENFLTHLLSHIINRYGERTVSAWVFELSFYLSDKPYYSDRNYSSQTVWECSYQCIRRLLPDAVIAGPGLPAQINASLMELLIHRFLNQKNRPDIFTAFHFPAKTDSAEVINLAEPASYQKESNENFLSEGIRIIRSVLEKEGYNGLYYVTDWNFSLSNRNYVEDSCYRAAFYLKNIFKNHDHVDALGIWYLSDLIDNRSDSTAPLMGCAGIISKDGILKPSYYAFSFLQSMGSHLVYRDESCIITCRTPTDIQILCCNYVELGPNYYLAEENSFQADELGELFASSDAQDIHIVLNHLEDDLIYIVRQRTVNHRHGDVLNEWLDLNADYSMTPSDIQFLERKVQPALERAAVHVGKGTLTLDLHLLPNEIRWISIREARTTHY